ncbi:biotin-dependent carboxyltransferase family protein [Rhodobacter sp. Har01]|uniref:5-oxoprolinase subunit C family protein n=1 Tax=Rhodobacter sp. Har01 TaxID=2883999 RepID=UPI001D05E0C4|nr:biotin-dependent carboxyltransferase family protein [Rhodobacter sp. Har01]MCB6179937.1 biotin-dependent carboxyltransferase family protein [Rhodobacter sp. Har01]
MNPRSLTVLKPGLETTVQELPGRIGYLEQGFPVSGPFDKWSFRQANLLVGNDRDAAALECQFLGPSLRFDCPAMVAVTGADMRPRLDGEPVQMWQSLPVRAGQVLDLGAAQTGTRAYVALSGGIDTPPVLGSRAVFHMARVGGHALVADQVVPLGTPTEAGLLTIPPPLRPVFPTDRRWQVEAMVGPNDDWLDPASVEMFFAADWTMQAKSSRTGLRLTGPQFSFAHRALHKNSDHGQDPSNIIDHGYPLGAVNLAGQTPIILVNDSPSTGGFINPFTIASAAFWKLAQTRPGDILQFRRIDRDDAGRLRAALDQVTNPGVPARV